MDGWMGAKAMLGLLTAIKNTHKNSTGEKMTKMHKLKRRKK